MGRAATVDGTETAGDEWVRRVLGIDVREGARASLSGAELLPIWRETRALLDRQVVALQSALRALEHPDFDQIAQVGFNGLTGGRNTALMAALLDHDRQPSVETVAPVLKAIIDYEDLLAPGGVLEDFDANPLGISVSLRDTLRSGLSALRVAAGNPEEAG